MKILLTEERVSIPAGCKVTQDNKKIIVSGKRGTETLDISHMLLTVDIEETELFVRLWTVPKKHTKIVKTCAGLINNMIIGCTKGFSYKMKAIYKHFPITVLIENEGKRVVIKNFLGSKCDRIIDMRGSAVARLDSTKDYFLIEGPNIQAVSQSAANISQQCIPKNKDLRVFLDGTFVVAKGTIDVDE
ncbi:large subunit ribosomal protein L9e [Nematocida homosporus]|uniref:large subunit ribosomal protein L9e n=1 Tax=Nematocida homosporus TaxID=1912981 RepID=UPI00221E59BB|nr:large subunit ribosomal protein L9e [Nematocida homosporus]KAI5187301.1 large subunit ribosomal protein L9e [Nematocida homosporus]